MKTNYTTTTKRGIQTKWVKYNTTKRYDHSTKKWYDTLCTFVTVYGTTKIQVWQESDCSWSFSAGVKRSKVGQFQTAKAAKRAAKRGVYLSIYEQCTVCCCQ